MDRIKGLVFDVFGTLVDWRTSSARETEEEVWVGRPPFSKNQKCQAR
jgi:FMN phosphatase YigB (HAD superfamily)